MKNFKILPVILVLLFSKTIKGQLNFSISPTLCAGGITNVIATTGTLTALQYSWGALPSGPVFSAPTASSTSITFPSAGTFTIALGILTGSGFVYSTNTIVINALPTLTYATTSNSVCAGFTSTLTGFGSVTYTWTGTSFTAPVNQQSLAVGPGSYTVSGTSSAGCVSSTSLIVGLYTGFNISISQSSPTTCITSNQPAFSKPVTLLASGAATYVWFPSNTSFPTHTLQVRPISSTCYTVIGSSATCSAMAVSCVTVIPQFTLNILPSSLTICAGETHALQVGNVESTAVGPISAWTYSWSEALNAPPISISSYFTPTVSVFPQNSTSYTLELRDSRDCISVPAQVSVTVNNCTGTFKESLGDLLESYPNPVTSQLTIRSNISEIIEVSIDNILGESFMECSMKLTANEETTINLSNTPSGVYYMKCSSIHGTNFIRKIIKE